MKALVQNSSNKGDAFTLENVAIPLVKGPYDIVVDVMAANVNKTAKESQQEVHSLYSIIHGWIFGNVSYNNRCQGLAGAGKVTAVGDKVSDVKVGDRINFIQPDKINAYAEKVLLKQGSVYAKLSDKLSYEDGAAITYAGLSAMTFINPQYIKPGMKVFVYGAQTGAGTFAVSLAKVYGASVTASATPTQQSQLSALKVDRWLDASSQEHLKYYQQFDVVYDASGEFSEIKSIPLVGLGGRYFSVNSACKVRIDRLEELNELASKGKLPIIIDQVVPLNQYKQAFQRVNNPLTTGLVLLVPSAVSTPVVPAQKKPTVKPKVTPTKPAVKKIKQVPSSQAEWLKTCNVIPGEVTGPGLVEVLGVLIPADTKRFAKGQAVRVAIHPSDLYVSQKGLLQGIVINQGFRGVNYTLKVKIQNTLIDVLSQDLVEEGQEIRLSVLQKDVHLVRSIK